MTVALWLAVILVLMVAALVGGYLMGEELARAA